MNNIEILITNNNTKLTDLEWNVQSTLKKGAGASNHENDDYDNTRSEYKNTRGYNATASGNIDMNATGGSGRGATNIPSTELAKPMPD